MADAEKTTVQGSVNRILLKLKYSFYSTLVFVLITNPMTYSFTQSIFKGALTIVQNGVPTAAGYFLHAALFFLVILGIMQFPKD